MALFICSCIFACSSWLRSLARSASFCCSTRELCWTAALAWSDAWVACSTSAFRSFVSFSTWMSWVAMVSAAALSWATLAVSPAFSASAAMTSAWRVLALSRSRSVMRLLSRSSACFWLAMTLAACSFSRRCWSCASRSACSSCTAGSAISLNAPVSLAVR